MLPSIAFIYSVAGLHSVASIFSVVVVPITASILSLSVYLSHHSDKGAVWIPVGVFQPGIVPRLPHLQATTSRETLDLVPAPRVEKPGGGQLRGSLGQLDWPGGECLQPGVLGHKVGIHRSPVRENTVRLGPAMFRTVVRLPSSTYIFSSQHDCPVSVTTQYSLAVW